VVVTGPNESVPFVMEECHHCHVLMLEVVPERAVPKSMLQLESPRVVPVLTVRGGAQVYTRA
jgi:hypothetical protein